MVPIPAPPRSAQAPRHAGAAPATARWCVLSGIFLLAACAEFHWDRPGADATALEADLQACAQQARLDARRAEVPRTDSPLAIRADPRGRPYVAPNTTRDTERYLREQDLTGACMRGKGYTLVQQPQ